MSYSILDHCVLAIMNNILYVEQTTKERGNSIHVQFFFLFAKKLSYSHRIVFSFAVSIFFRKQEQNVSEYLPTSVFTTYFFKWKATVEAQ